MEFDWNNPPFEMVGSLTQREIEESAMSYHERYQSGQDVVVGVN